MKSNHKYYSDWIDTVTKVFPFSDVIEKKELQFAVKDDDLVLQIRSHSFVVKRVASIHDIDQVPAALGSHPILYLADRLSTTKAEEMRTTNRAFVDLRGNAFIPIPDAYLFVAGRNAPVDGPIKLISKPTGKLFKKSGVQLISLLLSDPNLDADPNAAWLNQSVRELATKANIATGSVSELFAEMKNRNFLITDGTAKRLINRKKLLDAWVYGYTEFRRRRKRQCFTSSSIDWWERRQPSQEGFRWGGESAAAILTNRFLRPGRLTLYTSQPMYDLVVEHNLYTSTGDWTVEIIEPLPGLLDGPNPDCVHPLLVYADLLATGDGRTAEAALRIYENHLRQTIESA